MQIPQIHNDEEAMQLCKACRHELKVLLAADPTHQEYRWIDEQLHWVEEFLLHSDVCRIQDKENLLFGFFAARTREHFNPSLSQKLSQLAVYIERHPTGIKPS